MPSTATSTIVTGLSNGTAYTFRVAAVNSAGQGAWATSGSVTPSQYTFVAIPSMTSNTAPSGTVALVSYQSGYDPAPDIANAWKLFDGVTPTASGDNVFIGRFGYNNPQRSLTYTFASGVYSSIGGYSIRQGIQSSGSGDGQALHWFFQGSNDAGSTWTTLDTRTVDPSSNSWSAGESRSYYLASTATYNAYRWLFDDANDSGWRWSAVGLLAPQ